MSDTTTSSGAETCGCCAGIEASTPQALVQRPGLSAIAYRIGEHAHFKASLVAGLSSRDFAALAALKTRDADDFTLGLLDAFACAADVLTFYQERIANESYLRTATERVSLQEMGRLIGYRLRPGVAAETLLAFALEPPLQAPAGASLDPGAFVTGIPAELTLEAGLAVKSVPGPDEESQTFETVETVVARPEWNSLNAILSETRAPGVGATETWLDGVGLDLEPGDALVFAGSEFFAAPSTDNHWDFRLVDAVEESADDGRTKVSWKRGLGSVSPSSDPSAAPRVFALRKRAAIFGHNAPLLSLFSDAVRTTHGGSATATEWSSLVPSPNVPSAAGGDVDLDAVYGAITVGSLVVLAKGGFNRADESFPAGTYVELYVVTGTSEVSRAQFAISGKVTRLSVTGQNLESQFYANAVLRTVSVFAQSEELAFAPYPIEDDVADDELPLAVDVDGLEPGRRLIVKGRRSDTGEDVVHSASLAGIAEREGGSTWTISPPLPAALERDSVVVHANVALARHGESGTQILGAGDASKSFQAFELQRTPLTWRAESNETGAAPELVVRVGDVEWTGLTTLYGSGPTDRVYALHTDEQDKTWVVFGDGERGARLSTGVNNVRATYRKGIGAGGNVSADSLTQLSSRPVGLKSVANPAAAEGGTDAEGSDEARGTIPLGTRTLGRAVSVLDYEDFARAFTGIAKAQARVLQLPAGPTIAITVAAQGGAALGSTNPVWVNLLDALRENGDPHVHVRLLDHAPRTFRIGLKVKPDPSYELESVLEDVEAALRERYAFDARSLGQPVLASDVIGTVHAVPGVVAIDLDRLYLGNVPSAAQRLLARQMRASGGVVLPSELLTLDPGPLDHLEEMP